ncbi:MAG: hypothetical protein Q9M26_08690, partial [Mariprofundales bacterium]|nr:hypothetical protein [Mariprofundales bacterium]
MIKKTSALILGGLLAIALSTPALAHDDVRKLSGHHMHGRLHGDKDNPCSMMGAMRGVLMVKEVDGFTVSFHIMKAMAGMKHGGRNNLMIKVKRDGKVLTDLVVNSKVTHPNGKSESKMMMQMGDWYAA